MVLHPDLSQQHPYRRWPRKLGLLQVWLRRNHTSPHEKTDPKSTAFTANAETTTDNLLGFNKETNKEAKNKKNNCTHNSSDDKEVGSLFLSLLLIAIVDLIFFFPIL